VRADVNGQAKSVLYAAALLFLAGVAPQHAPAQTRAFQKVPGKLEMRLKSSHPPIRSGAPFSIELEFESTFKEVITGPLEITFTDDNRVRTRLVTTPVAITPESTSSHRIELPAMACLRSSSESQMRVELDSTHRRFNLGTHDLLLPIRGMRQFVIGAPGLNEVDVGELVRHLSLDEFRPHALNRQNFATFPVELDAHRIQGDPIELYAFDVLVFSGKHFSSLSSRQLETLGTWCESGGGLVIVPTGALTDAHCQFLARLSGLDRTDFQTDKFARLPSRHPGQADWLTATNLGFGRALILRTAPQFPPNTSPQLVSRTEWIRVLGLLWNVRARQLESIFQTGGWSMPPPPPPKLSPRQNRIFATTDLKYVVYGDPGGLKSIEPAAADQMRDMLFPADVRVVPFGVVVGVLTAFLLAVAPADYWILGWLRRRRFTWIVFPCVSILFTVLTVCIAGYYSGNTDHRGSLVIVDIAKSGRPLRTTQISHVITADTHSLTTEIRDGLFAKTDVQPAQPHDASWDPDDDLIPVKLQDDVSYDGLLPSAFTVTWQSRQWSPAMHRVTRIAPDVDLPTVDWASIDRLDLATESGRNAAVQRVRHGWPQCSLLFTNGKTDISIPFPATAETPVERFADWAQVLSSLGRRRDYGLMAILFGISPNGGGDLEDLAVLDDADATTWLVHAAIVRDKDLLVFRHVVRKTQIRKLAEAELHR
jgi:hypothetical protein